MKTLLFSARDAAAAFYAAPLIHKAISTREISVRVVAQDPALSILTELGIDAIPVLARLAVHGGSCIEILDEAARIIMELKPDAIIAGLSSRGQGGVDEALLHVYEGPTALIQDFWGEWNDFFGTLPDLFLVIDDAAKSLTQMRYGCKALTVGSIRHGYYIGLDPCAVRQQSRDRLGIVNGHVAGWFGQTLHHLRGYTELISLWADAMLSTRMSCTDTNPWSYVYKPHPRETEEQKRDTLQLLTAKLGEVWILDKWSVEEAVVVCDGVTAVMSNCLYDAAYLNYFSPEPLVSPVALLASKELYDNLSRSIDFSCLPYQACGISEVVTDPCKAMEQIQRAHELPRRTELWAAAKSQLADPRSAADIALGAILELVR